MCLRRRCRNQGLWISLFYLFPSTLAADHVSHLENVSEDEINRLLGMVVDVENLFMSVHKEEDTDTKQVYFYLFKVSLYGMKDLNVVRHLCVLAIWLSELCYPDFSLFLFRTALAEMHPADDSTSGGGVPRQPPI